MNNGKINEFTNFDFKGLSGILQSLSPLEFATLGSIVAAIISIPLNSNELNSLGNFLELVGQFMLTVQAQMSYTTPATATKEELDNLKNEINYKFNYLLKNIKN